MDNLDPNWRGPLQVDSALKRDVITAGPLGTGGGEMGRRVRAFDRSRTPLGPIEGWPLSLRTAVATCLNSRFPMMVWRHPDALGRSGRDVWSDVWQ